LSKFDRVMAKAPKLASRADGSQWMARLIAAALMDELGEALDGVAKTVDSL
jgi:indolepyruvate ferredoxin oxidoreductase beta subunit